MIMRKLFIISIFFLLLTCQQKNKMVYYFTPEISLNSIINFEVSNLNKNDNNNLYYVIQVKDLLYIVKTNEDNLLSFMLNTEVIGCNNNSKYKILYLESKEPLFDISDLYNISNSECDIILPYIPSKNYVEDIEGIIFKIDRKGMILLKKGDISREILQNGSLKTKYIRIQEPR